MKINEVIRKYRKEQNLRQEQIANYLGVTAPAVKKWENGISYPDITLLAPLARALSIDLDTLLSFKEDLTDKEIDQLVKEVSETIDKDGYEQGFEKGDRLIKEYPNCDTLILHTAQILNAFLKIKSVENPEGYETKIINWYGLTAASKKDGIASQAAVALVSYHMSKEEYEKAQQLLDKIPAPGYDKRIMQAMLFSKQEKNDEAYEIYEQMLFKASNEIAGVLQIVIQMLCQEKKLEEAERYADMGEKIAEMFDLGAYTASTLHLFLAIEKQDKEKSINMLERMADGLETTGEYRKSTLYRHMKFNWTSDLSNLKKMIGKGMEKDKTLDFVRNEPRFKRLMKRLEE